MPSVPESGNNSVVDSKTRPNNLKIPEAAKYTDVTRTSSASFKPPMSKDPVLKKKTDAPQADSTWFTPLFYIKNMFGGNKSSESSSQGQKNEKNKKAPPVRNTSNITTGKVTEFKEAVVDHTMIPDEPQVPSFIPETATAATIKTDHSPRFSFTADEATGKRNLDKRVNKKVEPEEDVDPNAPKYNPLRFVENKSTYLHTPDKKGTTSFRITTSSKVKSKPNPVTNSPKFGNASKRTRRSPVTSRHSSASPKKIPHSDNTSNTNFPTRLRSKSTPDHSSIKARLPYNPPQKKKPKVTPKYGTPPRERREAHTSVKNWTPPSTDPKTNRSISLPASQVKVSTWREYERGRKAKDAVYVHKRSNIPPPSPPPSPPQQDSESQITKNVEDERAPKKTSSITTFFSSNSSGSKQDVSPARKAIETFMGVAMDALSTKISKITKPQESVESPVVSDKSYFQKNNNDSNASETKSDSSIFQDAPFKNTWFARFFDEKPSPIMESKAKMKSQQVMHPDSVLPMPNEDLMHKRPKDKYAYIKTQSNRKKMRQSSVSGRTPKNKSRSVSPSLAKKSTSLTGKEVTPPSVTAVIKKKSFHDILKSASARTLESQKDASPKETSFKSILSTFSSTMQEKLIPSFNSDPYSSSHAPPKSVSSSSSQQEETQKLFAYYIKKQQKSSNCKHKSGNSKTMLTGGKSPKESGKSPTIMKKEGSSFLKSRQDCEMMPKGHPSSHSQFDHSPRLTAISPYNRSHIKHNF